MDLETICHTAEVQERLHGCQRKCLRHACRLHKAVQYVIKSQEHLFPPQRKPVAGFGKLSVKRIGARVLPRETNSQHRRHASPQLDQSDAVTSHQNQPKLLESEKWIHENPRNPRNGPIAVSTKFCQLGDFCCQLAAGSLAGCQACS